MRMALTKVEAIPMKESLLKMEGISERTVREHWKLYEGYVNKTNEIREKLAQGYADLSKAHQTYSDYRALKVELSFAWSGVKNHEIYFSNLGGSGGEPGGRLAELIRRDFGSFSEWVKDLKASGMAARGWVWLALDYADGRLYNYVGDSQNTYPIWDATPILALDTYEHAYFIDYGTNRGEYIEAFLHNLDWEDVAARLESAIRRFEAR